MLLPLGSTIRKVDDNDNVDPPWTRHVTFADSTTYYTILRILSSLLSYYVVSGIVGALPQ